MAASVIPVLVALEPALEPIVKSAITHFVAWADKLFGGKTAAQPTLGATVKFPWVQTIITSLSTALTAVGKAGPTDAATLSGAIQNAWNELDKAGVLQGHGTVIPPITLAVPPLPGTIQLATSASNTNALEALILFATWLKSSPIQIGGL